jgi:hypothetical protein
MVVPRMIISFPELMGSATRRDGQHKAFHCHLKSLGAERNMDRVNLCREESILGMMFVKVITVGSLVSPNESKF